MPTIGLVEVHGRRSTRGRGPHRRRRCRRRRPPASSRDEAGSAWAAPGRPAGPTKAWIWWTTGPGPGRRRPTATGRTTTTTRWRSSGQPPRSTRRGRTRVPPPMVHTRPPATMGEPLAAPFEPRSTTPPGRLEVTVTAWTPLLQGTNRVPLRSAEPPSGRSRSRWSRLTWPPTPPEVGLVEHVGGLRLAHLEDQPVGQEGRRRRSQVEVGGIVRVPVAPGRTSRAAAWSG